MSRRPLLSLGAFVALPLCAAACGRIDYELGSRDSGAGAHDGGHADAVASDGAHLVDAGKGDTGSTVDAGPPRLFENVRLTTTAERSSGPAIASGGGGFCVTWTEMVAGGFVAFARLYDTGFMPLSAAVRLSATGTSAEVPVPVHNGTGWGVFWLEVDAMSATVVGTELDASGSILTTARALTGATSVGGNVAVTFDGTDYWIGWGDSRYGGAEVIAAKVPIGLTGATEVRVTNAVNVSYFPALASTGSAIGVAWADNRTGDYEIYFALIEAGVVGPEIRVTTTAGISLLPALAFDGTAFGLVWNEGSTGTDEIRFARVAAGSASGERVLSGPAGTLYPSIAWSGDRFAVVWGDDRDGDRRVYGAAVTAGGTTAAIPIADPGAASSAPWITADGASAAVVWEDARHGESEIYAARGRFE